jgi:FkbM family methyltransferase
MALLNTLLTLAAQRSWQVRQAVSYHQRLWRGSTLLSLPIRNGRGLDHLVAPAEPWMTPVVARIFAQRSGFFLDVGANDGGTLLNVLEADPTARYLGFEPQVAECAYLQELIDLNRLTACTVLPVALSDAPGVATLYVTPSSGASSLLLDRRAMAVREVPVVVVTGDAVLEEFDASPVAIIKVDVEGAELTVLHGLTKTLQQHRPFLILEVLPFESGMATQAAMAVDAHLRLSGYRCVKINPDGSTRPVPYVGERIAAGADPSTINWQDANYVAIPQDCPDWR